jgi:hypothetical protein
MNEPFDVRPAADHDANQLSEFLNACTLRHQGIARSSPEDMLARVHRKGSDPAPSRTLSDTISVSMTAAVRNAVSADRHELREMPLCQSLCWIPSHA